MSAIPGLRSGTAELRQRAQAVAPVRTEAVGLLAAGLAHDLNNMLGGIVATAELLTARGPRRSADARDLEAIVDQAVKASDLVRQILAFSRQDLLNPVTADLTALVRGFEATLAAMAGRRVRLRIAADGATLVRIDPTALERVLVNLVLNAREAIAERPNFSMGDGSGTIELTIGRVPPGAAPEAGRGFMPYSAYGAVSVADDGPGIDPAVAGRIFDPYFTTRSNGQGLGLSTAFGLVKQSGGFLLQDRSPLGGARFTIYLPEAAKALVRDRGVAMPPGRVLLLVEDDLLLRMSAARGLERRGYRVRQAADGEAALARLEAERPSVLVSDIRMPGMDGIELARRARERHPGLPVLLVTGFADAEARSALADLDVGFLPKPFTLKSLAEKIEGLS